MYEVWYSVDKELILSTPSFREWGADFLTSVDEEPNFSRQPLGPTTCGNQIWLRTCILALTLAMALESAVCE